MKTMQNTIHQWFHSFRVRLKTTPLVKQDTAFCETPRNTYNTLFMLRNFDVLSVFLHSQRIMVSQ